jgi:hypothetical protein
MLGMFAVGLTCLGIAAFQTFCRPWLGVSCNVTGDDARITVVNTGRRPADFHLDAYLVRAGALFEPRGQDGKSMGRLNPHESATFTVRFPAAASRQPDSRWTEADKVVVYFVDHSRPYSRGPIVLRHQLTAAEATSR